MNLLLESDRLGGSRVVIEDRMKRMVGWTGVDERDRPRFGAMSVVMK